MIKASAIIARANTYIREKLYALAEEHNIHILLAIESGSRAWGFPSQNSDYDVRFIYARYMDNYLSVEPFQDIIQTPLENDPILGVPLDLIGWDIKKALQLAIKSNAALIEWLTSPVLYVEEKIAITALHQFATSCADLNSLNYHYDRLTRNAWNQITESAGNPKLKIYCYALRPALALEWIRQFHETPPMDVYSLCNRLPLSQTLKVEMATLFSTKASANEDDLILKIDVVDEFILSVLKEKIDKPNITLHDKNLIMEANQLFKRLMRIT